MKHGRDETQDMEGFLSNLQDWEVSLNKTTQGKGKGNPQSWTKTGVDAGDDKKPTGESSSRSMPFDYSRRYDPLNSMSATSVSDDHFADAASEKDMGNEYFKRKKFGEAIDCYSRSIALSPTAVAYANRAMAYLKLTRFQEAEDDCTEALDMDDRYIKAYSRRATARKELGKLKECIEDAEFALRLEPHNQEIKKQYAEAKSLHEKVVLQRTSIALENTVQKMKKTEKKDTSVNNHIIEPIVSATQKSESLEAQNYTQIKQVAKKQDLKASVQELASRAASLATSGTTKNIASPTSAYEFETSWRGISGDRASQVTLLKTISPGALPQIFKNALTVPILVDIVKCIATFFSEEMDVAVSFLENLTKVPRFDMLVMCVTASDRADLVNIWNETFCDGATPMEYVETLDNLRAKYYLKR